MTPHSNQVEYRLSEEDKKGPNGRLNFEDYMKAVGTPKVPAELSDEALFEEYDGFMADYHRYSAASERNYAIVAVAAEIMRTFRQEIFRRMSFAKFPAQP